jgi:AP-1 complex subunit beta-1
LLQVFYFQDACDVLAVLSPDGRMERGAFLEQWKSIGQEHRADAQGLNQAQANVDAVCPKLEAANVFFIARRKLPDGADMVRFAAS